MKTLESSLKRNTSTESDEEGTSSPMRLVTLKYPVFTNEVVVIRPQIFYLNETAAADNTFMKDSGMTSEETDAKVIYSLLTNFNRRKKNSRISNILCLTMV
jgi:hypothetical protein